MSNMSLQKAQTKPDWMRERLGQDVGPNFAQRNNDTAAIASYARTI